MGSLANATAGRGAILAACSFAIQSGAPVYPDLVIPHVIANYVQDQSCEHLLLCDVDPLTWGQSIENVKADDIEATWLNAVGLTDSELKYYEEYGIEALKNKLREADFDMADLNRPSVV